MKSRFRKPRVPKIRRPRRASPTPLRRPLALARKSTTNSSMLHTRALNSHRNKISRGAEHMRLRMHPQRSPLRHRPTLHPHIATPATARAPSVKLPPITPVRRTKAQTRLLNAALPTLHALTTLPPTHITTIRRHPAPFRPFTSNLPRSSPTIQYPHLVSPQTVLETSHNPVLRGLAHRELHLIPTSHHTPVHENAHVAYIEPVNVAPTNLSSASQWLSKLSETQLSPKRININENTNLFTSTAPTAKKSMQRAPNRFFNLQALPAEQNYDLSFMGLLPSVRLPQPTRWTPQTFSVPGRNSLVERIVNDACF